MALRKCLKIGLICCLYITNVISLPMLERMGSEKLNSGPIMKEEKKPKSLTISIERPESVQGEFNDNLTDDEAEVLLPKAMKRRMGRFLFDLFDKEVGSDSYGGYASTGTDDIFAGFGRLFNLNIDSNAVMTGVLQPENIAIHVAQNFVNFASSSLAWLALGALTSRTHISRQASDEPMYEVPEDYTAYGTTALPSYVAPSASKVRSSDGDSANNSFLSKKDSMKTSPKSIYVSPDSEQGMNDVSQEELERERLYELQVQEYRRRKKLEQLISQKQQGAASEQIEVMSDRRNDKIPFRLHPTLTPEEQEQQKSNQAELDRRLMKIESYKTYLSQQEQNSAAHLSKKREQMTALNEPILDMKQVQPKTMLVKRKGPIITSKGGNVVRRVRKIIKKPSSFN